MAKLSGLHINIGQAGHSVRHEFAPSVTKGSGSSLGMSHTPDAEHNFGPGDKEQHRLMTHIASALGFKKVATEEGKEYKAMAVSPKEAMAGDTEIDGGGYGD